MTDGDTSEAAQLRVAAQSTGLALSDDAAAQLLRYLDLLMRWNATYNLTSVRDRPGMRMQHLVDCLAVIEPLRRVISQMQTGSENSAARVLDVGSGGGLPGVVIAQLFPAWKVVCVDTVGKKVAFIRQVALEVGLRNLSAEHTRVEAMAATPFDVITSRAFASLRDFVSLTKRHRSDGTVYMAMKGKPPTDELAALPSDIDVFHVEQLQIADLNAERCLVWMRAKPH